MSWRIGLLWSVLWLSAGGVAAHPIIREQREVVVDGVREVWRVQWRSPPSNAACNASDTWMNPSCPSSGDHDNPYAYGESGEAELLRFRHGRLLERFSLTSLFELGLYPDQVAILPAWPARPEDERFVRGDQPLPNFVKQRRRVQLLNLKDYDHDGRAVEFVLQLQGHTSHYQPAVVVGLDRRTGRLTVWRSAEHPERPLILPELAMWKAWREKPVVEYDSCNWDGTRMHLHRDSAGLHFFLDDYGDDRAGCLAQSPHFKRTVY